MKKRNENSARHRKPNSNNIQETLETNVTTVETTGAQTEIKKQQ
jgi:hypothetical protein